MSSFVSQTPVSREEIQRCHRDVHAASHHQGISWDAAAEDFGRQALGLPPAPGRYG